MGTIFAVTNQKGGVGKTTTTVNLAACTAEAGFSTLLIDLDPQCNATVALGLDKTLRPSSYDLLTNDSVDLQPVSTSIEQLSVVPATPELADAAVDLVAEVDDGHRLKKALAEVSEQYAFVFIDCPPSLGPLTLNALFAADRVIVPVQTEYFALEGLAGLLETVSRVQRSGNPRLTVAGILLTMHDARTKLGRDVEQEVRNHFPGLVFRSVIPRNVRLGEAPSFGLPVIHHDPHCAGSEAYFELAKEVVANV